MIHPIPPGTRDVLPDEMRELRAITERLRHAFEDAGYGEVWTPAVEYEDVLKIGDPRGAAGSYRMFDERGRVLALRSDMTIPIARMVATRFPDATESPAPVLLRPRLPGRGAGNRTAARVPPERDRADRHGRRDGRRRGDRPDALRARRGGSGAPPCRPRRRRSLLDAARHPRRVRGAPRAAARRAHAARPGEPRHAGRRARPGGRRPRHARAAARAAGRAGGARPGRRSGQRGPRRAA